MTTSEEASPVRFEEVASGFKFLEAGRVDEQGRLFFSDYARGGCYRLDPDGSLHHWLPDLRAIGGLALNDDGRLVIACGDGLSLFDPLSDRRIPLVTDIAGEPRCFNDVEPDGDGGLFAGTIDLAAIIARTPPRHGELIHIAADRQIEILDRTVGTANGIARDAARGLVYLSDTGTGIWRYRLDGHGRAAGKELHFAMPDSDGLELDAEGNLWVAAWRSGVVLQIDRDGRELARHRVPRGEVLTLAFGGRDGRDLHLFTGSDVLNPAAPATAAIYRGRVSIPGKPAATTSFR